MERLTYTCLKALEETVRNKFSLGIAQIEFYSSCGNLCGDVLTKIDEDVWELVAPCIGSITVVETTPFTIAPVAGQFRLYICMVADVGFPVNRTAVEFRGKCRGRFLCRSGRANRVIVIE